VGWRLAKDPPGILRDLKSTEAGKGDFNQLESKVPEVEYQGPDVQAA
jgi:hypothetical protein